MKVYVVQDGVAIGECDIKKGSTIAKALGAKKHVTTFDVSDPFNPRERERVLPVREGDVVVVITK